MITGTLSTSTSLCAARTAASGLVSVSSTTSRIGLPSKPPLRLISSVTACIAFSMRGPSKLPAPVSGVSTPRSVVPAWARTATGAAMPAAAVASSARRVRQIVRSPLYAGSAGCAPRKSAGSPDRRIAAASPSRLLRPSTRIVARCAISRASAAIPLHHGDGDALAVDRADGGEQFFRRDRRQSGGRFVEQ